MVTADEWAAIQQFLKEAGAPGRRVGRAAALPGAALKLLGMLLLFTGLELGYADGNEFDEVGCTVAQQPGGSSHRAHSAQAGKGEGGKLPGAEGGSAGGSGVGGGAGRPGCEVRAAECRARMADGECRILQARCPRVEGPGATATELRGLGSKGLLSPTLSSRGGEGGAAIAFDKPLDSAAGGPGAVAESLAAKLSQQLRHAPMEKLGVIERFLGGQPLPDPQQNPPPASQPASSELPRPPSALRATIEGDPASGRFRIHVGPASEAGQAAPPEPPELNEQSRTIAAKVFQLLTALDPSNRLRKAPPIKVFLLRFRKNLPLSQIAKACDCAKSLAGLRLKTIQEELPWKPQQLRELSAHVEAMEQALSDSRAKNINRMGAVYGDQGDPEQLE